MNTRTFFPKKDRENLLAFGKGMAKLADKDGPNRKKGANIVRAMECIEYLEAKVKELEKRRDKAVALLMPEGGEEDDV